MFLCAQEREQFGRPIGKFQSVQEKLVDMATEIEAARLLIHKAGLGEDRAVRSQTAAMAKLYWAKLSHRVANWALQIHGDRVHGPYPPSIVDRPGTPSCPPACPCRRSASLRLVRTVSGRCAAHDVGHQHLPGPAAAATRAATLTSTPR